MTNVIPSNILAVYHKIQDAGFACYFVGGGVRNLLMERVVKDWDLATNAIPEQILKIFPDGFYDNQFGTVGLPIEIESEKQIVEITTYRTETGYADRRHPQTVEWGKTIEEDLARRDFTINAIALKLTRSVILRSPELAEGRREDPLLSTETDEISRYTRNDNFEIVDPFNGQVDIKAKLIRAVGDPQKRFKEDSLRLMRAVRLATELSFTIEEKTWEEIRKDAPFIAEISKERIRDELKRVLASDYPYEGIILLKNSGLLTYIIPELLEGIEVSQIRPDRHHQEDVFIHNIFSLKFCPSTDPIVRFATLLHDIGKPKVAAQDEQGLIIFHNHEIVGARIAREICDRLRFARKERDKVVNLIRWHMFTVDEKITDAAVRRFIRRVGVENVQDMMDLRIGDRLGGGTQTSESWRLKLFKKRVEQELQPAPFSINDLAIDGHDIMKELNIKPGPKIGEILQKLFEEIDEDLSKNNQEYLLKRIREMNTSDGTDEGVRLLDKRGGRLNEVKP